ncbi:hypothetical protein BD626DRAFT_481303 [Schizophyllum amplum]|uniref:BZIP domain-containing protein n=1 Tax=Schizophyllum amplum TaxID=97359 RepID=A0A550CU26_9AGAR|nr:hypothetical protein BD626DRAFT_481303 [Auriculariopsis ampla]
MADSRDRSESRDFDSDAESATNAPGKPGRKKNPNGSQAARRDQNRIAQREFRLRKQQRIRDLEARVEILSGTKDEALGEMRNMLKDLMQENQTLRNLIRSLATFIGDGAGGLLPKIGWDMAEFNNFVNRGETDTAFEGYQRRKKAAESGGSASTGQKRSMDDDGGGSSKRAKADSISSTGGADKVVGGGYPPMMMPPMDNTPLPASALYGGGRPSPQASSGNIFPDLMRAPGGSPGMFMQSAQTSGPGQYSGGPSASNLPSYSQHYLPMNIDPSMNMPSFSPPTSTPTLQSTTPGNRMQNASNQLSPDAADDDDDPNKNEAYKLIHYHLDNYKRNGQYCLPSSLRPTLVQRTVPHESVIDRILHPELRDRMILMRGKFDLVDCLLDYRNAVTIHGDDVLAHNNWEIGEKWVRQYSFLVDPATLAIANRWRRERGDQEILMNELAGSEASPSGST